MADVAPRVDDRAPVPGHVAWAGTADRRAGSAVPADVECHTVGVLAAAAKGLGIRWLTVQVAGGAAVLAPALADDLGPGVEVRVLGPRDAGGAVVGPSPDLDPVLTVVLADGGVGRSEIVHAVDALARSGIAPDALDEPALARHLFDPGVPDPDLVVVTGGDRRIPDLLTWEMAYSELVFLDATWPLLEVHHFSAAVEEYRHRNRRYGGLEAPKRPGGRS